MSRSCKFVTIIPIEIHLESMMRFFKIHFGMHYEGNMFFSYIAVMNSFIQSFIHLTSNRKTHFNWKLAPIRIPIPIGILILDFFLWVVKCS